MSRSAVATDNFNRADGGLGANWSGINDGNAGAVTIATNVIGGTSAGATSTARWNGTGTFNNDQYSTIVFVETDAGSGNYGIGAIARASADTDNGRDLYLFMAASNDTYILSKTVNGTTTNLATGSQTWTDGDRVEIECEGTTIRGMRNGTTVTSQTDSALTTGKPGVAAMGDGFIATGDDWEGGNLVVGDVTTALSGSASSSASGTSAPGTSIGL